jgi:formylmethanofuran dehydrogenase subunit D
MMPRLLGSSKITARHQITLSEEVMKALKVKEGEMVAFVEENGKVVLKSEI